MNITFFETQLWEKEQLQLIFPDAKINDSPLSEDNASEFTDTTIISLFIYSKITAAILDKLPNLKYIVTRSTGYDHIDLAACKARNIAVSNVPEYGSNTVAEFTFGLLLDVTRNITRSVLEAKQLNFDHEKLRGVDLHDKTIGIIGLGKIGQNVLSIARGFGMKVLVYNHSQDEELAKALQFSYTDLDTLLQNSDFITLHVPLVKETTHIINTENIIKCKKGSFLINTARGGLVDTQAILLGLEQEILAGVGLDVLEGEDELIDEVTLLHKQYQNVSKMKTLLYNHILLTHPKVLITPHNAFNSKEALQRILDVTIANIKSFANNTIQNTI
ncbi:MAG TPA: NAD(P)-dependent oxidoreductase [Candidatus Saccharimonadales bacterium]|nr:NAD(P)-dependent oxidoreductase [Candidatus Saccharimonadales bacterium]